MTLGAKLLSGRSLQGGLGGGLDILGQATEAAAPQFGEAIKAKQIYDATDPEAGLKEMALQMALKEEDDIEYSDPTEVKIKYEGADETNNALRTFDKDRKLKEALGMEFAAAYLKMKSAEWASFTSHFSTWEKENTIDI